VSVLSREELRAAIAAQPPLVEGIDPQTQLQPNGIDQRAERIQRLTSPGLLGAAASLRELAARDPDVAVPLLEQQVSRPQERRRELAAVIGAAVEDDGDPHRDPGKRRMPGRPLQRRETGGQQ